MVLTAEFYKHGCNELIPALVLMFITIIAKQNIYQVGPLVWSAFL